jgi:UDP-3-O-[3-hydroxymyristoyl] N-acetylglucosamine deacetylase
MPSAILPDQAPPPQLLAAQQSLQQQTLAKQFHITGIGLHTGEPTQVTLRPALAHQGRYFLRQNQETWVIISANIHQVRQTVLATELSQDGASVQTVEHLLAALVGMGIDNVEIVIDGPEVPLLEGSARIWAEQILQAGWQSLPALRPQRWVSKPVIVEQGESFVVALPAAEMRFSYEIDFPNTVIGQQWFSFTLPEFWTEIAPCRTFGSVQQIQQMRDSGLVKGGSLDNALVCDQTTWLNPPLHFANEPVRHKLLDLLGDLSLLGSLPRAHYLAHKASHTLHIALAKSILAQDAMVEINAPDKALDTCSNISG